MIAKELQNYLLLLLKKHLWRVWLLVILILVSSFVGALMPWPYKILVDNILGNELFDQTTWFGAAYYWLSDNFTVVGVLVVVYLLLITVSAVIELVLSRFLFVTMQRLVEDFGYVLIRNLFLLDYGHYQSKKRGDFYYLVGEQFSAVAELVEEVVVRLVSSVLYLFGIIVVMWWIDLKLMLIASLMIPILMLMLVYYNKKIGILSKRYERKNSLFYIFVEEMLSQFRQIQVYNQEQSVASGYVNSLKAAMKIGAKLNWWGLLFGIGNTLVVGALYVVVIVYGVAEVESGLLTAGVLLVFVYYLDSMGGPVVSLVESISLWPKYKQKLITLNDLFVAKFRILDHGKYDKVVMGELVVDNLTLATTDNRQLVKGVSTKVEHGKLLMIVGKTGSGKSSILAAILRLNDRWDTGKITLGGVDIRDYKLRAWRENLSYVPQESELFDQTIMEVVKFGSKATEKEVIEACQMAQADDFIRKEKEGYHARVGQGGNLFSGGERQRLLLARAYLRKKPILILDEPFSGIDKQTQQTMINNLRKFAIGRTVVLVTHDESWMRASDVVLRVG